MYKEAKDYLNLAHKNLADTIEYRVKNINGGEIYKTEHYMIYTIGLDTRDGHLNGVLSFNDDYGKEIIEKAGEFFNPKGFSYSYWIRDSKDSQLEALLVEKGLSPKRKPGSAIMVIDHRVKAMDLPQGYRLEIVHSSKDIKDFGKVIEDAFDKTEKVVAKMLNSKKILSPPGVKAFLIYNENNKPVSAALTSMSEKVAGIYYVGTLEKWRGLGLGNAIVEASTNIAFDQGKEAVILQASAIGEIVYSKLGYEKISYYRSYPSQEENKK